MDDSFGSSQLHAPIQLQLGLNLNMCCDESPTLEASACI